MSKRNKTKDACLHCLTRAAWRAKWSLRPKKERKQFAFNDLVYTAIKLGADVYSTMDEEDQMKFVSALMALGERLAQATDGKHHHKMEAPKPN